MAEIPINDVLPWQSYTASAGQTIFDYNFPIFDSGDLIVLRDRAGAVTVLAVATDYTVSGVGAADGGTVTLTSGATAGDKIILYRDVPISRLTDYAFTGDFRAETVNRELDLIIMMMQQLERDTGRSLKVPIEDDLVQTLSDLPSIANRAGRLMAFDGSGQPTVGANSALVTALVAGSSDLGLQAAVVLDTVAGMTALASSGLVDGHAVYLLGYNAANDDGGGMFRWDASSTATADGVLVFAADDTPATGRWLRQMATTRVSARQAGAVLDGVADDTARIQAWLDIGGALLLGKVGDIARVTSQLTLPDSLDLDMGGALIQAEVSSGFLFRHADPGSTSYAVSAQAADDPDVTLSVVATGLTVGDLVNFRATNLGGNWPIGQRRIEVITDPTGTPVITLDAAHAYTYTGTVTLELQTYVGDCAIYNGEIEASGIATSLTHFIWLEGYRKFVWEDVRTRNVNLVGGSRNCLLVQKTRISEVRNSQFENIDISGEAINLFDSARHLVSGCEVQGDNFGITSSKCDDPAIHDNSIRAQFNNSGSVSVRGIKVVGAFSYMANDNRIENYDSGIKIEDSGGGVVSGNQLRQCGVSINVSHQNPSATYHGRHAVVGNAIYDNQSLPTGAISINTSSDASIVAGNVLYNCQGDGIRVNADACVVDGNMIYEWGLAAAATYRAIVIPATTKPSSLQNNAAYSAEATNAAWNVHTSAVQINIENNRSNVTDPYETVPSLAGEVTVELGGGMWLKKFRKTISSGAQANYAYATAFPNDTLMAVGIADGVTLAVTDQVIVDADGSSAANLKCTASTTGTYQFLVLGW